MEDGVFRERCTSNGIELAGRGEVAPERLFDDDARVIRQTSSVKAFYYRREKCGGNRKVVCGTLSIP